MSLVTLAFVFFPTAPGFSAVEAWQHGSMAMKVRLFFPFPFKSESTDCMANRIYSAIKKPEHGCVSPHGTLFRLELHAWVLEYLKLKFESLMVMLDVANC